MSAIIYMINGFKIYAMKKNERNVEMNTIKHILQQNQCKINNLLK
jgi:hypothetical protein